MRYLTPLLKPTFALVMLGALVTARAVRSQEHLPRPQELDQPMIQPPDPSRVFRLESEATLYERMAAEAAVGKNPLNTKYKIEFPQYAPAPRATPFVRDWPPLGEQVEPCYVCYGRLYFEQINAERYGWDLGIVHPLVSAGKFWFDVAALPYRAATDPWRTYECDAGYALPGDPIPLMWYHPELNVDGALGEAAAVGIILALFP